MHYYIAKKDIDFMDGTKHLKDHCYFPLLETQAYFDVMANEYYRVELFTIVADLRILPTPNHKNGYTKSYLYGWMESTGVYSVELFRKWMNGQTVGMTDNCEVVYYYHDVIRYFTRGGITAEITD